MWVVVQGLYQNNLKHLNTVEAFSVEAKSVLTVVLASLAPQPYIVFLALESPDKDCGLFTKG